MEVHESPGLYQPSLLVVLGVHVVRDRADPELSVVAIWCRYVVPLLAFLSSRPRSRSTCLLVLVSEMLELRRYSVPSVHYLDCNAISVLGHYTYTYSIVVRPH